MFRGGGSWKKSGEFAGRSRCQSIVTNTCRISFLVLRTATQCRLVQAYRPKSIQCPVSTPFLRDKTQKFCTRVWYAPAEALMNGRYVLRSMLFSVFFRQIFCVFVFFEVESHISGEKKTYTPCVTHSFVNGSAGAYKTRVQKLRVYLSKTAWPFGRFCR